MKKRETELDILRLLALLGVIFTHACGIDPESISGDMLTFLTATVTWHVPVFVMISGRFFLDPEREMTAARLRRAIGRLVIAFTFWSALYQLHYIGTGAYAGMNWKGILSQAMLGPYHFWYLFMLICLYAVTPFLRRIAEERRLMEYFIALFLIFEFLTLYGPRLPFVGPVVSGIAEKTEFHFALGFTGYYILGIYLHRYPLSGKKEIGLYALGIAMFLFTGFATVWKVRQGAAGNEWFSKYLMPNVAIEAAALYTFFVSRVSRIRLSRKQIAVVTGLAEYSFGAYLIHALVLEFLARLGVAEIPVPPVAVLLLTAILCWAISTGAAALIRKIPGIGKRIT